MPFAYSPQYRAMVINQIHDGKPVTRISAEFGLNPATIQRPKKQDRLDQGLEPGTPTNKSSALQEANRRIRQLETELGPTRRGAVLFDESQSVRPKTLNAIIAALRAGGHSLKACYPSSSA